MNNIPGTPQPTEPNRPPETPTPGSPGEEQTFQPEVDPSGPANDTEVDLDRNRNETFPDKNPPERH